jgi:uncharacterized protein YpmB
MKSKWLKWSLLLIVLLVAMVGAGFYLFVKQINGDLQSRQASHVRYALKHTSLIKALDVQSYHGDKKYTIVRGPNKDGLIVLVWLGRGYVRETYEVEGLRRYMIRKQFELSSAGTRVLRIQYAVHDQQPAWEVYYERLAEDGRSIGRGYKYYHFHDGLELADIQTR